MKKTIALAVLTIAMLPSLSMAATPLTELQIERTIPTESIFDVLTTDDIEENLANEKKSAMTAVNQLLADNGKPKSIVEMEAALNEMLFPVHTPSLSAKKRPGSIMRPLNIPASVVVIGNDNYSLSWLEINQDEFVRLGAAVMLVEVKDAAEYSEIAGIAPKLQIYPVPGLPLADLHGLTFYPALLTPDGIFQ